MKNKLFFAFFSALLILAFRNVQASVNPTADEPVKYEDFKLKDYNGKEHSLSDYKGSKAIVIMFVSTQCPVSNAYNERMEKVFQDYKSKGIAFIGINSNKKESVSEIKQHAADNKLQFTILKDERNVIADKFGASFTPEIYVLSGGMESLYHGRIDDSRKEADVTVKDLRNALNEILAGKNVSVKNTKAFGCTIKRVEKG